jgi:threonine synthase
MSSRAPKLEFVATADASCRGGLREVLLSPMPAKGGLWVPTTIPQLPDDFLTAHRDTDYATLAEAVMAP